MIDIAGMAVTESAEELKSKPFPFDVLKKWTGAGIVRDNSATVENSLT